jgi:uncharacterized Tic20 family protein
MSNLDELQKLHDLKEKGAISQSEYLKMKDEILNKREESFGEQLDQAVSSIGTQIDDSIKNFNEDDWGMFLHLSQLAGYILPVLGFAVPIFIWITKERAVSKDRPAWTYRDELDALIDAVLICGLSIDLCAHWRSRSLWCLGLISLVFHHTWVLSKLRMGCCGAIPGAFPFLK